MAFDILLKRSSATNTRPDPNLLQLGELAVNYNVDSPGLFFRNSANQLTKVGPVAVTGTAPNSTPGGFAGNSIGEMWLDTSQNPADLKIYTSTGWVAPGSSEQFSGKTTSDTETPASSTFFGVGAGSSVTTGARNTFFGWNAGSNVTTGANNLIAGASNITAGGINNAVVLGYDNGNTGFTGGSTICIGTSNLKKIGQNNYGLYIGAQIASAGTNTDVANSVIIGSRTAGKGARYSIVIGNFSHENFKDYFSESNTIIGNSAFNLTGTQTVSNNVVVGDNAMNGLSAQAPGSANFSNNIVVGARTFTTNQGGTTSADCYRNVVIGYSAGNNRLGSDNILLGYQAATATGPISGAIILGPWQGSTAEDYSNSVIIAPGGNVRLRINGSGAFSPGGLTNYGSAGQVLKSNGSGGAPYWSNLAGAGTPETFVSADGKTVTIEDGVITSIS